MPNFSSFAVWVRAFKAAKIATFVVQIKLFFGHPLSALAHVVLALEAKAVVMRLQERI